MDHRSILWYVIIITTQSWQHVFLFWASSLVNAQRLRVIGMKADMPEKHMIFERRNTQTDTLEAASTWLNKYWTSGDICMSKSRAETSTASLWKLSLFLSFVCLAELAAKCCKSHAEDVNESLMWIYRLFPGFCLGHGLFEFFGWQQVGLNL